MKKVFLVALTIVVIVGHWSGVVKITGRAGCGCGTWYGGRCGASQCWAFRIQQSQSFCLR